MCTHLDIIHQVDDPVLKAALSRFQLVVVESNGGFNTLGFKYATRTPSPTSRKSLSSSSARSCSPTAAGTIPRYWPQTNS